MKSAFEKKSGLGKPLVSSDSRKSNISTNKDKNKKDKGNKNNVMDDS
jgi:hypothetical protein